MPTESSAGWRPLFVDFQCSFDIKGECFTVFLTREDNLAVEQETEALKRKSELTDFLQNDIEKENKSALVCRWASYVLMLLTLAAVGIAGIGGTSGYLTGTQTGFFALIAAFLVLVAGRYKFQEKDAWHARKRNRFIDLKDQLLFQPESPSIDNIAAISKKRIGAIHTSQEECESELTLDWSKVPRLDSSSVKRLK
jgi:hypothetical protein